ncbi:MAG: crossover junction endodeoxyribonuclease RuvC [Actinomycetota bacterium]
MIILGIDPGTSRCGYGIVRDSGSSGLEMLSYGVIETKPKSPVPECLRGIFQKILEVIDEFDPDAVAVEQVFYGANTQTALSVGQARGVILLAAATRGLPVSEYTPLQVKQAVVGYGRAEKAQVQYMVKALLKMSSLPTPDDAADALAVAICHAHCRGMLKLVGQK